MDTSDKLKLTPHQAAIIYMEQANHYSQKQMFKQSEKSYDDSLELRPDSVRALLARSKCKRNLAKSESALEDLTKCTEIDDQNVFVDQGICDNLYDLNELEKSIVVNRKFFYKYLGNKSKSFNNRYDVIIENIKDSLGNSLEPFIMKYESIIKIVAENMKLEKKIETRPLWKQLRDEEKCDVQSIPDFEEILLSPLERARRNREYRIFLQTYINKSWKDVEFLKMLSMNQNFLIQQSKAVTPKLTEIVCTGNETIKKFLKMLQVRSPMYNEYANKCSKPKLCYRNQERQIYRIQYQTRRDMMNIMRMIHSLRAKQEIHKLENYVEKVMGDYVVLKTTRVMPWKIEFINEVYNVLGLAYTDRLTIPKDLFELSKKYRLKYLLHLPLDKHHKRTSFAFGDRDSYNEQNTDDPKIEKYKKYLERIKFRLIFAKYAIEKSYLYFEMSRSHIFNSNYDDCVSMARKALEAAKECNNYLWQFLSIMQIIKARAALKKLEYISTAFVEAREIVKHLKNKHLRKYVIVSQTLCDQLLRIKIRQQHRMHESMRPRPTLTSFLVEVVRNVQTKNIPKTDEDRLQRGFKKWKKVLAND